MIVILKAYQMRVDEGILDVSVAKQLHDLEDVFGPVVFCCGFPVARALQYVFVAR